MAGSLSLAKKAGNRSVILNNPSGIRIIVLRIPYGRVLPHLEPTVNRQYLLAGHLDRYVPPAVPFTGGLPIHPEIAVDSSSLSTRWWKLHLGGCY